MTQKVLYKGFADRRTIDVRGLEDSVQAAEVLIHA